MEMMSEFEVVKKFVTKDKETFELAELVFKNFVEIKDAMAAEKLKELADDIEKAIGEIDEFGQDWIVKNDLDNITGRRQRDVLMIGKRYWFQQDYHFHIFLSFDQKDCQGCYIGVCGNFEYVKDPFNKLSIDRKFSGAKEVPDGFKFGRISNESVVFYIFHEYTNKELYKNLFFYEEHDNISKNIIDRITELIRILEIKNNGLLTEANRDLTKLFAPNDTPIDNTLDEKQ
ncbi:hypothetical protein QUF80_22120 [Desulfococcaceae bacterium HSG8]|nr:hypothetical protein [Desulfococcaceae bacterium HSG8]